MNLKVKKYTKEQVAKIKQWERELSAYMDPDVLWDDFATSWTNWKRFNDEDSLIKAKLIKRTITELIEQPFVDETEGENI